MSVPKKKKSRSAVRRGRSHDALKPKALSKCPNCGKPVMPHRACLHCGQYKGRLVLPELTKVKKKTA